MALQFRVLGEVQVIIDDQAVDLGHHQQRCVLAVLVAQVNRPVSAEQLVERIWGDRPPLRGRNAMYGYLSRLRRVLDHAGTTIGREPGGYVLTAEESTVDLYRFRQLVIQARALAAEDDQRAMALLDDALALWRGEAFGGLDTPWCVSLRSGLHAERRAAELDRVDVALRCGRHAELVAELSAWVAADPFDERVAGQLMLALYRASRQADALAVYQALHRTLNEELGIDPGAGVRELHLRILHADPNLDLPVEQVSAAVSAEATTVGPPVIPRQLPAASPDFTSRDAERVRVVRMLNDPGEVEGVPRIAVIVGPGGMGKTTLAVQAAHDVRAAYPDGQLYVDLRGAGAQPLDAAEVLCRFLRGLGVPAPVIPEEISERAALYRSLVAERRVLVLLDNAADERQLRPLLPGSRDCGVIITSRHRMTGLDGNAPVHLRVLATTAAVAMLRRLIDPRRVDAEPDAAAELAELCGALPLALRIMGARLTANPHCRLSTMVGRLADRLRRLGELRHADLDVRACLALSYQGLQPPARALLRRIGLLDTAEFPVWIAAALLDTSMAEAERLLDQLVEGHLADVVGTVNGGYLRYRCHDLIQTLARELVTTDDPEQVRHAALARVCGATLGLVEQAHNAVYGGDYALLHGQAPRWRASDLDPDELIGESPLAWADIERPLVLDAIRQAADRAWDELSWDLASAAVTVFETRGDLDDWYTAARHALTVVRQVHNRRGEAVLLMVLGSRMIGQQSCAEAGELCWQAERLFAGLGEQHGQALALRYLARIDAMSGRLDQALRQVELARQQAAGNRELSAHMLYDIIRIHLERDDQPAVRKCLTEALSLSHTMSSARLRSQFVYQLGELHLRQGRLAEAEDAFHETTRLAEPHDLVRRIYAHLGLAEVLFRRGRTDLAADRLHQVLAAAQQIPERFFYARTLLILGQVDTAQHDYAAADHHLRESIAVFRRCAMPGWEARAQGALAAVDRAANAVPATLITITG